MWFDVLSAAMLLIGQYRATGPFLLPVPGKEVKLPLIVFVVHPRLLVGCVDRLEKVSPLGDVQIHRACLHLAPEVEKRLKGLNP